MSKEASLITRTYETGDGNGTAIESNNQIKAGRISNSKAAQLWKDVSRKGPRMSLKCDAEARCDKHIQRIARATTSRAQEINILKPQIMLKLGIGTQLLHVKNGR
jgi:hypothetical protein